MRKIVNIPVQNAQPKELVGSSIDVTEHERAEEPMASLSSDSVNLIWSTLITYLATPWVNQLPHPGRSEALRRP